jgi:hypothetical protein
VKLDDLVRSVRASGDAADDGDGTRLRVRRSLEARAVRRKRLASLGTFAAIFCFGTLAWALATGRIDVPWRAPHHAPPEPSSSPSAPSPRPAARGAAVPPAIEAAPPAIEAAPPAIEAAPPVIEPAPPAIEAAPPVAVAPSPSIPAPPPPRAPIVAAPHAPIRLSAPLRAPAITVKPLATTPTPAVAVESPTPAISVEPPATAAAPPSPSPFEALYRRAHDLHFHGSDPAAALAAWDAYLAAEPTGRFAIEATYNRALVLVKLHRYRDASAALAPFARGEIGAAYRQSEAQALVARLAQYE